MDHYKCIIQNAFYYSSKGYEQASKAGFLFKSTDEIKAEYPDIPAYETYDELLGAIKKVIGK